MDCVPGGDVKTRFFQRTRARINTIPSSHVLFGGGNETSDSLVEARAEVAKAIVASVESWASLTFQGVFASGIERLVAHNAMLIAVVAARAFWAKGQSQAIPEHEREMWVRAGRRFFAIEIDGKLEKAAGSRATSGAKVNAVVFT